jgi:hypothetical protein
MKLIKKLLIFGASVCIGGLLAYMYMHSKSEGYANQVVHGGAGGIAGPVSPPGSYDDRWLKSNPSRPVTEQDYSNEDIDEEEFAPGSVPQIRKCLNNTL